MTLPRHIVAGQTWFVTRRTVRRHFLLRPDVNNTMQQLYWYITAVLCAEFGIELHAVQVLSTHMHEVLTDTLGCLPQFLQQRNRLLANSVKVHRRWPEEVFSRGAASCVKLVSERAVLKEIGYTLANCVEAGLTHSPEEWPGVTVSVDDIGKRTVRVRRPEIYFDPENARWPEYAELPISMPPALRSLSSGLGGKLLRAAVDQAVGAARLSARATGRLVGAVAKLTSMSHTTRARSYERFGNRNPGFAAGGARGAAKRAIEERREFHSAYREAMSKFTSGVRDVLFPAGTWRWRHELGCATRIAIPIRLELNVGQIQSHHNHRSPGAAGACGLSGPPERIT